MNRRLKHTMILMAGVLVATVITGCSPEAETRTFCDGDAVGGSATESAVHVILIVGNVANAPEQILPPTEAASLGDLILDNARVDVISTAGDGHVCTFEHMGLMPVGAPGEVNEEGREATAQENLAAVQAQLVAAPRENGADLYSALHLAAGQLASIGATERYLLVLSSGLNDRGQLAFTQPGALGAQPSERIDSLKTQGPLPSLQGAKASLVGVGYSTTPQQPLDPASRSLVVSTYTSLLQASGAEVTVDPWPMQGDAIDTQGKTVEPVTLEVPVPPTVAPKSCTPQIQVFTQAGGVKFVADEASFIDPTTAQKTLLPVVEWLTADPTLRSVDISGTTARWGHKDNQITVGLRRAEAVRALLLEAGVQDTQIGTIEGLGSYFPEYQQDVDPSGRQIPEPAALNRSIRLTLHEGC